MTVYDPTTRTLTTTHDGEIIEHRTFFDVTLQIKHKNVGVRNCQFLTAAHFLTADNG